MTTCVCEFPRCLESSRPGQWHSTSQTPDVMALDVSRMLACCAAFGDVDGSQEHKLRLEGLSRWLPSRDSFLLSPVKTSVLVRRLGLVNWEFRMPISDVSYGINSVLSLLPIRTCACQLWLCPERISGEIDGAWLTVNNIIVVTYCSKCHRLSLYSKWNHGNGQVLIFVPSLLFPCFVSLCRVGVSIGLGPIFYYRTIDKVIGKGNTYMWVSVS